MMMICFKKSQIIMVLLLLALLIITSLLSSSFLRSTCLYFVFNLLIIALGAEAGLLSNLFSKPKPNKPSSDVAHKKHHHFMSNTTTTTSHAPLEASNSHLDQNQNSIVLMDRPKPAVKILESSSDSGQKKKVTRVIEKSASEKVNNSGKVVKKVKKCPSTPSIFFIGSGGDDRDDDNQDLMAEDRCEEFEEYDHDDHHQDHELFTKAETFIGNFYKQLKMQREDSWKKIHGIYQNIIN